MSETLAAKSMMREEIEQLADRVNVMEDQLERLSELILTDGKQIVFKRPLVVQQGDDASSRVVFGVGAVCELEGPFITLVAADCPRVNLVVDGQTEWVPDFENKKSVEAFGEAYLEFADGHNDRAFFMTCTDEGRVFGSHIGDQQRQRVRGEKGDG